MKTNLCVHYFVKFLYLFLDLSQYKINELSFNFSRTTEIPGDSAWETILGNEESHQQEVKRLKWNYSLWKPPYVHPIKLIWSPFLNPLYCGQTKPQTVIFLFKEPLIYCRHPINTTRFLWPIGDWINKVPLYLTYLTVIPGACIGYEMAEAQSTKLAINISYPTRASRIILFYWKCPHNIEN